jgi:hypothetical protein
MNPDELVDIISRALENLDRLLEPGNAQGVVPELRDRLRVDREGMHRLLARIRFVLPGDDPTKPKG